MNMHYNNEKKLQNTLEEEPSQFPSSYQLLNLPLNELFSLSFNYYSKQEYETAYSILHNATFKQSKIPNLHYNLAKCAYHLENYSLCKYHLRTELQYFNNLKAFNLLDTLEVKNSTPYLTFSLGAVFIIIYFAFFQNFSNLDIFLYSLHQDNITTSAAITSLFFHSSTIHLLSNIAIFLLIGSFLEQFISKFEYLSVFFIAGIGSNIIQVLLTNEFSSVLGMSGAIFGFLAILALKAPLLSIQVFKIKIPLLTLVLCVYIFSVLTMNSQEMQIAHFSHLFGFLIGLGIGVLLNSYLRAKFYALLVFSFGTLLTTSSLLAIEPIFLYSIIDLVLALSLITFSLIYLDKRENALEEL